MSYMVFSVGSADMSHIGTLAPLVKEKLTALGASRVSSSLILTGELAGAGIATSSWDSVDASIAGRAALYADPEAQSAFGAASWSPIMLNVGQVLHERGNGEGAYSIGVAAVSENHDPALNEQLTDLVWGVASNHGVNGMRSIRAVAAGDQTGSYMNIFYTDSVDGYLAASAELSQNAEFVGFMADNGGRITNRTVSRTMG
ncbi:MAG: hypothetical protein QF637_10570 [Acidimicrobiales bacterium]|nr:hypothetical protein [Acidimicrobiales bacterium]